MSKQTIHEHQQEMLAAIARMPSGTEFTAGDTRKFYGYPHADAAKVLQQDAVLFSNALTYSVPPYRAGKIRYLRTSR